MTLTEVEHLKGGLEREKGVVVDHIEVIVNQVDFLEGKRRPPQLSLDLALQLRPVNSQARGLIINRISGI